MKSINGYDLEDIFDTIVTNGVKPFLALPTAKPPLSHDFPNENGQDIDTASTPTFAARTFTFNCVTSGDDMESLKANYLGLFSLLRQPGLKTYFDDVVNMSINIIYQQQSAMDDLYDNSNGGLSVKYSLQFTEADPDDNIPTIILVDDQNRVLVP